MKKYVPRSIQNIFDRIEAYNESITDVLFSEPLSTTFEVVVYMSLTPETKIPPTPEGASDNVSNYHFYSARSLAGHHDHLVPPDSARSPDEYERFRNSHFQAIIKTSADKTPQDGDVWLATYNGGNLVTLVSKQRSGTIITEFDDPNGGPAQTAHTNGQSPAQSVSDYQNAGFTAAEATELAKVNKDGKRVCKDPKDYSIHNGAAGFITKIKASSSFAGWSAAALAGLVANAQAESNFDGTIGGDAVKWYKKSLKPGSKKLKNVEARAVDGKCSFGYWQLNICPDNGAGRQLAIEKNIDTTTEAGKAMWRAELAKDEFQFEYVSKKIGTFLNTQTTDPYDAAYQITTKFERPACKHIKARERGVLAKKIYDKFKKELEGP